MQAYQHSPCSIRSLHPAQGGSTELNAAPAAPKPSTAAVRAWARTTGLTVPDRGKLRPEIETGHLGPGLLSAVVVTAASIRDRDAAHRLLAMLRGTFSTIRLVWADGDYPGRLPGWANSVPALRGDIIERKPGSTGFHVRPRAWMVERIFVWLNKYRRCVRDYEAKPEHHEAMVLIATIATMTRRRART